MSLVREALAKAEREAAARAARERGLPEGLHAAGQPYRAPRRGRRAPALLALLALAALALGAAAYLGFFGSGSTTAIASQAPAQKIPSKGTDEAAAGAVAATELAAPDAPGRVATPDATDAAEGGDTNAAAPATPRPAGAHPSLQFEAGAGATTAGQRPPIPVDSVKPKESPAPARAREPDRFVREAVLDGGATRVALGGIAWSEAAPLAYLNGELRGVGESVAGLEIRSIERDRVVLAARDRTIVVSLR